MNFTINSPPKECWILIRGLTRGVFHWFDFPEKLAAALNHTVITLEVPGNGTLSDENFPKDLEQCVHILKAKIDPDIKINLMGISLGGMIAAKWTELYPEQVQKLVLINSSFSDSAFFNRLRPGNYFNILKLIAQPRPEKIEEFILSATSNTDHWKSKLESNIAFHQKYPLRIKNLIQQLWVAMHAKTPNKPIENCTILIGQGDRFVHPRCSLEIAKKWKVNPQIHPTAGHDLPLDAPEWIIEQIKKLGS